MDAGDIKGTTGCIDWNDLFRVLYPVAFESARLRLDGALASECADVAMETLAGLSDKSADLPDMQEHEVKRLTAAIARNKARDRIRKFLAAKRQGGSIVSLEALSEAGASVNMEIPNEGLDALNITELNALLTDLSESVKKRYRVILRDYYLDGLSHEQIAALRGMPANSVGKYVERGLASLRQVISRTPGLRAELRSFLNDHVAVHLLIPLISAAQLGDWIFHTIRHASIAPRDRTKDTGPLSGASAIQATPDEDEEWLQCVHEELPKECHITDKQHAILMAKRRLGHAV